MSFTKLTRPAEGTIKKNAHCSLNAGNDPIIPFIEGDGIGIDITPAMKHVVDSAVGKASDGEKKINWFELYTGEKALEVYGNDDWRPQDTLTAFQKYLVGIEGPLTTPVGGGYRYRKMTKSIFLLQHSPCTKIP